jgi:hypothetical protein
MGRRSPKRSTPRRRRPIDPPGWTIQTRKDPRASARGSFRVWSDFTWGPETRPHENAAIAGDPRRRGLVRRSAPKTRPVRPVKSNVEIRRKTEVWPGPPIAAGIWARHTGG